MSHVSDSDHRRLEAKVFPDHCVVESHEISDASRGLRRVPVTRVWRTERLLGRGGFGEVHLQSQEAEKDVKRALKIIPTRGMKLSHEDCQRELTAMIEFTKPKYRNAAVFVDFIGWFQNDDAMFLAMEYMPLGDLEQNMQEIENSPTHTGPPLSEEEVQEISRQILEGLKIMHAEGFAHRDLKPQNVFVVQKQPQWWVKLGDFGLSKKRTDGTAYRTQAGTQQYMAPELFYYVQELDAETSEYTNAIDLWSLGCIIFRIVTGAVPFPSLLSLRNYCRDPSKVTLNMPPTMEEAGRFVENLLMPHPANRPVASAALESTWLTIKNKPKIALNEVGASFDALDISRSQNNYNTVSHKGLQSYISLPAANDSPTDPITKGPATEPLPAPSSETLSETIIAEPESKLQDENKLSTAQADTIKLSPKSSRDLKRPGSSLHLSTSQPTRSTTTSLHGDISGDGPQTKPGKHFLVQPQTVRHQLQLTTKEDLIASNIPRVALETPALAIPATGLYLGSTEVKPLAAQKMGIPPRRYPDSFGRISADAIPAEDNVAERTADLNAESGKPVGDHIITETTEKLMSPMPKAAGEGSHGMGVPNPATAVPVKRKPLPMIGQVVPDSAAALVGTSKLRPLVGEMVPDLVKASLETMKRLPSSERTPGPGPPDLLPSKIYPPGTHSKRESLQVSDIQAILESHNFMFPVNKSYTKDELLTTLNQIFHETKAPGRQFYYYNSQKGVFYCDDSPDSLPPGWECRLSRAGEKYYYNRVSGASEWDDPRTTKPNAHVKPRSNPFQLPRTSEAQIPPSRPTPLERGRANPPKPNLPEGWAAEFVMLPHGKAYGWKFVNTLTRAEQYSLPTKPASAENGAISSTHIQGSGSEIPKKTNFWMKALFDFDPQYEDDLRFSKGDLIVVTERQIGKTPQDGWLFGEINGRTGTFPANYCLRVIWMKTLFDFDPVYDGDLRLSAGDLIRIINVPHDKILPVGWLVGEVNGRSGMFPANYCELVAAAPGPDTDGPDDRMSQAVTDRHPPDMLLSFITPEDQALFTSVFKRAVREETIMSGAEARNTMVQSGLDATTLSYIWMLADTTRSGTLYFPEFALAMCLCNMKLAGETLPQVLPENIKAEIAKAISYEPARVRYSAQAGKAPDFSVFGASLPRNRYLFPQAASQGSSKNPIGQKDSLLQQIYSLDSSLHSPPAQPYTSNASQNPYTQPPPSSQPYASNTSQNSYLPPPPPSQPYASTLSQDPYYVPPRASSQRYDSNISQNPYVQPPPLSQPYSSTITQDDAKSSQPKKQSIMAKVLGTQEPPNRPNPMLSFSVFIKPPTGKTMKLRILQQDTIELVKRRLEVQEGYPAAYQCMIFGGKRLDDACTVESYNIKDGYTIHLVMPLTVGRAHNSPHDATASK